MWNPQQINSYVDSYEEAAWREDHELTLVSALLCLNVLNNRATSAACD